MICSSLNFDRFIVWSFPQRARLHFNLD
jgi:hypothetical protein